MPAVMVPAMPAAAIRLYGNQTPRCYYSQCIMISKKSDSHFSHFEYILKRAAPPRLITAHRHAVQSFKILPLQ